MFMSEKSELADSVGPVVPCKSYDSNKKASAYTSLTSSNPMFEQVEAYTVKKIAGPVEGLRVLDLGCGAGKMARKLINWGAAEVHGVDITPAMIDLAKNLSVGYPQISYAVITGEPTNLGNEYDMVLSYFVMHYMDSYANLVQYIKQAYVNLKKGGCFYGSFHLLDQNAELKTTEHTVTRSSHIRSSLDDFAPVHACYSLTNEVCADDDYYGSSTHDPDGNKCFKMEYYNISDATFNKALEEVGFKYAKKVPAEVSEEGLQFYTEEAARNVDFWCYFIAWKE